MPQENFLDNTKNQIIKDSSKFITSTYVGNLTGIITGLLTRKFLGPTLMGIWSYLQVIQYYANYSQLGILSATEKELPYYYGKNDKQKAEQIKHNAFLFTNIIALILLFLGIIYASIVKHNVTSHIYYGLITIAILSSGGQYGLFYTVLLRADKNIDVLSKSKILFAIIYTHIRLIIISRARYINIIILL